MCFSENFTKVFYVKILWTKDQCSAVIINEWMITKNGSWMNDLEIQLFIIHHVISRHWNGHRKNSRKVRKFFYVHFSGADIEKFSNEWMVNEWSNLMNEWLGKLIIHYNGTGPVTLILVIHLENFSRSLKKCRKVSDVLPLFIHSK